MSSQKPLFDSQYLTNEETAQLVFIPGGEQRDTARFFAMVLTRVIADAVGAILERLPAAPATEPNVFTTEQGEEIPLSTALNSEFTSDKPAQTDPPFQKRNPRKQTAKFPKG